MPKRPTEQQQRTETTLVWQTVMAVIDLALEPIPTTARPTPPCGPSPLHTMLESPHTLGAREQSHIVWAAAAMVHLAVQRMGAEAASALADAERQRSLKLVAEALDTAVQESHLCQFLAQVTYSRTSPIPTASLVMAAVSAVRHLLARRHAPQRWEVLGELVGSLTLLKEE